MPNDDYVVRFNDVGMRYGAGAEVLHGVSFALAPGSFQFLTGRSGAGKSTLLRLIYMAQRPSGGVVEVFGQDLTKLARQMLPDIRRRIGVVFQDFRLLDHLSTADNVALPLRIAGMKRRQVRDQVTELLRWVGLADKVDALPPTLSGGEQQRVAIARAVIQSCVLPLRDPAGYPRFRGVDVDSQINVVAIKHLLEDGVINKSYLRLRNCLYPLSIPELCLIPNVILG